jgi:beta-lactamase regulating signal transducer with metallopeptidase domain
MSKLDATVLVIAVQVTVPLLAALLLSFRRNAAASCIPLVWGAASVVLLTTCAPLPIPSWPAPQAQSQSASTPDSALIEPIDGLAPAPGQDHAGVSGGIDLSRLLPLLRITPPLAHEESSTPWLAYLAIGLAGLGLLRSASSWMVVQMARMRSRRLLSPELLKILDELRAELGCRKPIDIRECEGIGSGATIGWLRPTILLAPDWPLWSAAERRAVLAHEIAHVARRDFMGRLVARLAIAIHWYHPVLHWLVRRLELRQEMAADALASPSVGGRANYRRCLAALALKMDAYAVGMMPTFLSRPRTLLRRIAMLRVTEGTQTNPRRWLAVAIIGVLSFIALGFHGRTPEVLAKPPVAPADARPPLDVSQVQWGKADKDAVGYYALRVDELLKLPGIDRQCQEVVALLEQGFGSKLPLRLQDIEQIAGRISFKVDAAKAAPNHSVMMSLTMIRFNLDIDWKAAIEEIFTKAKVCKYKGETYYQVESTELLRSVLGPEKTLHFYPINARTLLFLESEDVVKQSIDAKKNDKPKPSWSDDWRQVDGGMLAIVFTDPRRRMDGKLAIDPADKGMSPEEKLANRALEGIFKKTESMVLGVDARDRFSFKISTKNATPADAKAVAEQFESLIKELKTALAKADVIPSKDAPSWERAGYQVQNELLTSTKVHLTEGGVVITGQSSDGMKALWKALTDVTGEKK